MADRLLSVGRTSDSEADGEELGDGATAFGVAAGEGVEVAGVVAGVAVDSGLAAGVAAGTGVAVGSGVPVEVAAGVADALGAGVGELEGCPLDGVAGCCSHPARRRLEKARATTKHLIMPTCTDARGRGIFKARCKGAVYQADCTMQKNEPSSLFLSRQIGLAENVEPFAG